MSTPEPGLGLENVPNDVDDEDLPPLTVHDQCDSAGCTSQAYVRTRLRSGRQLLFCAHHGHELAPALAAQGALIRDDSHLLVENRLFTT